MSEQLPSGDEIRELRGRLEAVLAEDRTITMTAISLACGFSLKSITGWRSAALESAGVAGAIKLWLDSRPKRKDWISTTIASQIRGIAHLAHRNGMMAAIVAPSGCGKSYVLKALARELNGIYVSAGAAMTPRELLFTIAGQLGHRGIASARIHAHRFIVKSLLASKRPILIDEAHNVGASVGSLRAIFDESGSTIILAGAVELIRIIDDRADGGGQLSSRMIRYNAVEAAAGEGNPGGGRFVGAPLFTMEEIEEFFKSREIRLSPDALRLAWQLANLEGFGCLRLIDKAQAVARDLEPGLEVLDRARLVAALKLLHGADFQRMQNLAERMEPAANKARVA